SLLNLISCCAELFYRSTHPSGEFGQLLSSEQEQHDKEDYHHVRPHKIHDTGDRWSHKHVSLNGRSFLHSFNHFYRIYIPGEWSAASFVAVISARAPGFRGLFLARME